MNSRKIYRNKTAYVYFVSDGISDGKVFMTVRRKLNFPGTHRVISKALPLRETQKEAEKDLAHWAKEQGLTPV